VGGRNKIKLQRKRSTKLHPRVYDDVVLAAHGNEILLRAVEMWIDWNLVHRSALAFEKKE
jgi:hypothetical protein